MGKPFSTPPTSSNNLESKSINLGTKISPTILLILVIFSILFFILGLLHLIVRSLLRPTQREQDELDHASVLQGQLQQLFHLHDSGVDQSYIDTLPVFYYKEIIGLKDPFDCAVCLCEFELNDSLRLLPKCSHAFHMECIDTWLLSHSTCPLCRSSLLLDYNHGCSSIVCVLESTSVENSREIGGGSVGIIDKERNSVSGSNPLVGCQDEVEFGSGRVGFQRKSSCDDSEGRIVFVKLGKFKSVDVGEGSSEIDNTNTNGNNNTYISNNININNNNNNNKNTISGGNDDLGSRRCYSMGSFAYVLDETTSLKVPIKNTPIKKQYSKKPNLPLRSGYRAAISEYGCDSNRDFNEIAVSRTIDNVGAIETGNERIKKRESYSLSKIWARGRGGREMNMKANDVYETSKRSNFELLEKEVSELGDDEETQSCYSVDSLTQSRASTSTNTRRTLLWLMGRHNKTLHNHSKSLSSNV